MNRRDEKMVDDGRKANRAAVLLAACLAIVLGAGIVLYVIERNRIIPPSGLNTLESFERTMPPPKTLVAVDLGGANIYIWVGTRSPWSIASGPPCYVFDSSGKLVEWDWQTGSGQPTTAKAELALQANPITVKQAMSIITAPVSP